MNWIVRLRIGGGEKREKMALELIVETRNERGGVSCEGDNWQILSQAAL